VLGGKKSTFENAEDSTCPQFEPAKELNNAGLVVLHLLKGLHYQNLIVFADNWYSSVLLARILLYLGFGYVGTILPTRKFLPSFSAPTTTVDMHEKGIKWHAKREKEGEKKTVKVSPVYMCMVCREPLAGQAHESCDPMNTTPASASAPVPAPAPVKPKPRARKSKEEREEEKRKREEEKKRKKEEKEEERREMERVKLAKAEEKRVQALLKEKERAEAKLEQKRLREEKKQKEKMTLTERNRGNSIVRCCGDMAIVSWMDTKVFSTLPKTVIPSMVHSIFPMQEPFQPLL
jgi:hypothetical protein